jgi:hypothetical protein
MKTRFEGYSDNTLISAEHTTKKMLDNATHELYLIREELRMRAAAKTTTSMELAVKMNVEHADVCDHIRKVDIRVEEVFDDEGQLDHYILRPPACLLVIHSFDHGETK